MTSSHIALATPHRSEIALYVLLTLLLVAALLPRFAPRPTASAFPEVFPVYHSACGGVALPC